ncbi:MAG: tandem-95 repeat protein [Planctomycetaceae bacterium]|nr:tandem-95 repeat protein [Planctomycetaceae bacterium]
MQLRSKYRRSRQTRFSLETLEARQLLAGDLMISEFMADNNSTIVDEDGDSSDWIEIYNDSTSEIALEGWHLTDNETELDKWSFPSQTLAPGNFLLVYASGKDRTTSGSQLHTNFKLSSKGEFLALTRNDANASEGLEIASQFTTAFPSLADDISYGIGQSVTINSLVETGNTARLLFPTDGVLGTSWNAVGFQDGSWTSGTNAIGYEQSVPGFTVHDAHSTGQITNIAAAEAVLAGSGVQSETTIIAPVVNFQDPGGGGGLGNYGDPDQFPNDQGGDDNDFGLRATGTILIPSAGTWTFGTNSDDGVRVWVDNNLVIDDDSLHAPANRFGQTNLSAGPHSIELVFFERGGGAEVELFAAKGSYSTFNSSAFDLIGDVANGGLVVETIPGADAVSTGYSGVIETDVLSSMYDTASGAYIRIPFLPEDVENLDSLSLRMRYDDGFVAYLNGVEVARRNAPTNVNYNSIAISDRSDNDALLIEDIDISGQLNLLTANTINVLAIHALNDSIDSDEFLSVTELAEVSVNESAEVYFTEPTPGGFNSATGVDGFLIDEIQFSHPHGFYDAPFQLTINARTANTTIRYTLDGTEPTESNGTVYTSPITISGTTTLRSRAFKNGLDPSNVQTATYLFLEDILMQSPDGNPPAGFPTSTNINGQTLDYGMDPEIVNSGTWGPQLAAAIKQVPSMSIVMDIDDLLGSSNGIYTHAGNHGRSWEREISLELINPDESPDFQINAGLRIRGGFSRSGGNPKHAFRLFFRDEYGDSSLKFPLFDDEGVDEFKKFDLRTTQNYSWAFQSSRSNAFVRDVFSRDLQGEMGHAYTRSRFYHLYINGQYWGLYQTEERPEANFAASYLGGDADDYDVVKSTGSSGGYQNEATDGNTQAYQRLANYFYQAGGLSDTNMDDYWKAQGLNPDGTINPTYERLLDAENLMDYMILTYYTSDADGPGSKFTRPRVNNYFTVFNRETPDGFKFFEHDSEHSLDRGNAAGANFNMVTPLTTGGAEFRYFNPHWMHEQLANTNTEYRQQFADRVYGYLFNDGLLTPENAQAVINSRAAEFDQAIIAESARWGDAKSNSPYTKSDWQNAINSVNAFINDRNPDFIDQLRSQNWYSDTTPPGFTVNGAPQSKGRIEKTDNVSLFTSGATTFDDILPSGAAWKYLDDGSNQGTAWRSSNFNDASWKTGNAQLGYGDGDEATVVSYGSNSGDKHRTTYFRKSFNVTSPSDYQTLRLGIQRDDGAIVYLNGQEIARSNMPAGAVDYDDFAGGVAGGGDESTFYEFDVDISALNVGNNVFAVEIHQANASSSDISFDLRLEGGSFNTGDGNIYYTIDGSDPRLPGGGMNPNAINFNGVDFNLTQTTIMNARVRNGSEWSPLNVAKFLVDTPATADNLAITEINYNPHSALTQFGELDVDNDQFEFVELVNTSSERIDLTEVAFVLADNEGKNEGIEFKFSTQTLNPGESIVVVRNRTAFVSRYGSSVRIAESSETSTGTDSFDKALSNSGELLTLVDAQGTVIQQFEYNDGGSWPGRADGNGSTLEAPTTTIDYNVGGDWRSSNEFGGSPGKAGTGPIRDVVINEILTHTDLPQIDIVELHNTTDETMNLGGWYISDNNSNYFAHQLNIISDIIPAGGYLTVDETQLGFGFKGQESDDAWLIAADLNGKPVRFADHAEFGATQNGVSVGLWPNGDKRLFPMQSNTLGTANSGPRLSNIYLGEVHYHPGVTDSLDISRDELEFVEVVNNSGAPADISHWRLDNAVDLQFPSNTILANGERITLVGFDPQSETGKADAFRDIHGMNATAALLGPYTGVLDNGGERLELERPEDLEQIGLGFVLVDRVVYEDNAPWPTAADGLGKSLHRNVAVTYGDFNTSWEAATPSPGTGEMTINIDPVANDDQYAIDEGGLLNVIASGVIKNDTDQDGDTLTVTLLTTTSNGSVTLLPNGSFTYSHDGGETNSDQFTYRVSDGAGGIDTGTVTIDVLPVNDPPLTDNDSFSLQEGDTLIISSPGVLENDQDPDGDPLTATVVTPPDSGLLVLTPDGGFSYTHDGSQTLADQFVYRANDGNGGAQTATVNLNILPVNDAPIAADDNFTTDEGGTLEVSAPGPLDNDSDPDGDPLNATLVTSTTRGTLQLNSDGSFSYAHDGSETLTDSFIYQVDDNLGKTDTATVTITIQPINDAPQAQDDAYEVSEGETLDVAAPGVQQNDTDPENGDLNVTLLQETDHGSLTLNENGSFRYTHDGSETTQDSFRYQITDNLGKTDTATVTITIQPINDAPVAIADSYSVSSRETLTVNSPGLLANDSDEDNENLSAILVDNVTRGTLTLRPDGSFTYTNNAGIEDAFSYLVSDGTIESAAVVVTIDVLTINVPGDLDGNGDVTIEDVNLLSEAIKGSSEDQTFDLSSDGKVDLDDLDILILEILGTYYGDANLDGQFDSSDLVSAFQAGEYEDSIANNSTWSEGDWNSDGDFTTADLVKSFQSGAYEQAAAARAVTPTNLGAALTVERAGDFRDQLTFKEPPSHGTNEGMRKTNIDLQNRDLLFAEDGFVNFELESRSGDLSDDLLDSINNDF